MAEGARKFEGTEMIQVSAAELAQEVISRTLDAGLQAGTPEGYHEVRDAILRDVAALSTEIDPEDEIALLKQGAVALISERFGESYVALLFPDVMQELSLILTERALSEDGDGSFEKWIDATSRRKVIDVINPSSIPPGMDAE
jgi:hypothetical protein